MPPAQEHDVTPRECPVQCALVFPFFLESCRDVLAEQDPGPQPGMEEGAMPEYEKFSASCTRQDTTALVEYAMSLKEDGCSIDLDAQDGGRHRLLQACDGFVDDPNGVLAATGVTCEQVLMLGCDTDIHSMQPGLPEGSLVSLICPVSCEACHRTGMAKWIETPSVCPWDDIDDKLLEVNTVCCGEDPDAACPRGAPPRECSPLCAVGFHSLMQGCGDTLTALAGRVNGARLTAFDQLCTSEDSVDPMFFLDAIANAECCIMSCKAKIDTDPAAPSGVYTMCGPTIEENFEVYCDMETNGGGWTLVMNINPADGNAASYNNQAFWTREEECKCAPFVAFFA